MKKEEFYSNPYGKLRPREDDLRAQSELRKDWFDGFQARLRRKNPKLFEDVTFVIVGSVAKGAASSDSNIDVVIKTLSADELKTRLIRGAIHDLLAEMKRFGEQVFDVDVQESGAPHIFNPFANFRRGKRGR